MRYNTATCFLVLLAVLVVAVLVHPNLQHPTPLPRRLRHGIVRPCEHAGQLLLCIKTGENEEEQRVAPPTSGISCLPRITDGFALLALEAGFDRVLVHRDGYQLRPIHYHSLTMDGVVFDDPSGPMSAVWAASPGRRRRFFELGCQLMETYSEPCMDDLFAAVSFGASFFAISPTTEPLPLPPQQMAYTTFLTSFDHDWYVESVRLMNHRIKRLCNRTRPFLLMLPREVAYDAQYTTLLEQEGVDVVPVDDIETDFNRDGRFANIWGKQRVWGLTDFDLVAYLDPDQQVLGCPEPLFSYPPYSHARTLTDGAITFNSGVLVVRPKSTAMLEVEDMVKTSGMSNDQQLTELYFSSRGYAIEEVFSMWKRHSYINPEQWETWKHCTTLLHFTGEKPWELPPAPGIEASVMLFFQEYTAFRQEVPSGPIFEVPFDAAELELAEVIDATKCVL